MNRTSSGCIAVINPARITDPPGRYDWSFDRAEDAVRKARRAFPAWSNLAPERRISALKKFKKVLARRRDALAGAISRETGKAVWESKEEIATTLAKFDATFEAAAEFLTRRRPESPAYCAYRPYGVAAVLGPFNFPVHLPHGHIVPALLAGNTVVFKPSDKACGVGKLYDRCAREAGIPAGVLSLVQGPGSVGEYLATHPNVKTVLFTGSFTVGRTIQRLTVNQPDKLLALEMGGKNAAVVFADADLSLAAMECARAAFLTAGQRCTSTSRIFVQTKLLDRFCEVLAGVTRRLFVGDPFDSETFCGPVISKRSVTRAEAAIREARRLGGSPVLNGGRFDSDRGFFLRLSAHRFGRYPGRCSYTSEEFFVPEVGIFPFDEIEEAARLADDTDYGLALAVFTRRRPVFEKLLASTSHGVVNWNVGTTGASGRLPFGGRKNSGNARPAGSWAFRNSVYPVAVRCQM